MKEICEYGADRPDFGGRWPGGEALGETRKKGRGGKVHFTMTDEDVETVARAVAWVAASGWRLLAAYTFVPETGEWSHRLDSPDQRRGRQLAGSAFCQRSVPWQIGMVAWERVALHLLKGVESRSRSNGKQRSQKTDDIILHGNGASDAP